MQTTQLTPDLDLETTISPITSTLQVEKPLVVESGAVLENVEICYTTFGKLNENKTNVVWIFHALTANSNPAEWWPQLVGEGLTFDPIKHFIVCANMLGSCYGTTGPSDRNFPVITIHDMVKLHKILRDHLGISTIHLGIGGSMGGQQLLEWAVQEPGLFEHIVPIATNAFHSAWGIAFNEAQRMALENPDPDKGLEAARAIAMLSYRHYNGFDQTQKDVDMRWDHFSASSYQQYQGKKLRQRFNVHSYYYLSKAMDSHHVGRHFGSAENALSGIKSNCLVIGVDSDLLFPVSEQKFISAHIPGAKLATIQSDYGHDGFLIEFEQLGNQISKFLS